jgi:hypothetical protein
MGAPGVGLGSSSPVVHAATAIGAGIDADVGSFLLEAVDGMMTPSVCTVVNLRAVAGCPARRQDCCQQGQERALSADPWCATRGL